MDHYEMVEKLRERANVTYDEARRALEASDWDLLDAMVFLENEGRMKAKGEYSTQEQEEPKQRGRTVYTFHMGDGLNRLMSALGRLIGKGNVNSLVITRKGQDVITLPLTALVILFLFVNFWWLLIVAVLMFVLGYRFTFRGPNTSGMNRVINKAADAVNGFGAEEETKADE